MEVYCIYYHNSCITTKQINLQEILTPKLFHEYKNNSFEKMMGRVRRSITINFFDTKITV